MIRCVWLSHFVVAVYMSFPLLYDCICDTRWWYFSNSRRNDARSFLQSHLWRLVSVGTVLTYRSMMIVMLIIIIIIILFHLYHSNSHYLSLICFQQRSSSLSLISPYVTAIIIPWITSKSYYEWKLHLIGANIIAFKGPHLTSILLYLLLKPLIQVTATMYVCLIIITTIILVIIIISVNYHHHTHTHHCLTVVTIIIFLIVINIIILITVDLKWQPFLHTMLGFFTGVGFIVIVKYILGGSWNKSYSFYS